MNKDITEMFFLFFAGFFHYFYFKKKKPPEHILIETSSYTWNQIGCLWT